MRLKMLHSAAFMMLAGITMEAIGAPVSPEAALGEAAEFLSANPSGIRRAPGAGQAQLSLAYTSGNSAGNHYYVFNNDSGFVIVSADDRLPAVLGYSDSGQFDEARLPDNMKAWMQGYSDEISHFLTVAPETYGGSGRRSVIRRAKRNPIEPLVTTRWDQGTPYNLLCPSDNSGRKCVTGCVATAYAQILRYHEWPRNPTGSSGGETFDGTTYNWRQMIDVYADGNYTASQAQAVATLMRQCGAAVNMNYSAWASGAYSYDVQYALPVYFKYSPDLQLMWKDYTPQKEWAQIIYDELAAGRPVFYSGASSQGGHAFVCDGYSENEYFHFNWGWGGYEDGYFLLTALNPASGGTGSYEAGYTSQQSIIIGIKPGTESAEPRQSQLLTSGGLYHSSGNMFEIKGDPDNYNLIYNPLGYDITFNLSLKIEASDGRDTPPVYVNCGSQETLPSLYGAHGFSSNSLPRLDDGVYRVTAVFNTPDDSEWRPVLVPIGFQDHVQLTVKDGNAVYANLGPDESSVSKLLFGSPETTGRIYGNLSIALRVPVVNVGEGDFSGVIGFSLTKIGTTIPDATSTMDTFSIPGMTSRNLDVTFKDNISPGTYMLEIMDMDGNVYSSGCLFEVEDASFVPAEGDLEVTDLAPNFTVSGKASPLYFTLRNKSIMSRNMNFTFNVLDVATLEKVSAFPETIELNVPGNYNGRVNVHPADLGLEPGEYLWCIADESGNSLSMPTPMIVNSEVKENQGISYVVTSENKKEAVVVAPEGDPYSSDIVLPEKIDGYRIKGLRNDAFTFASSARVTLPSTVTALDPGTFYLDGKLDNVFFNSGEVIPFKENIFNPARYSSIWLNAGQGISNEWFSTTGWSRFRTPAWYLRLEDVTIPGLEIDPATSKPYSPYRMNYLTPMTIRFEGPAGKNVSVLVIHNGEWIQQSVIDPLTTTVELPALGLYSQGEIRAHSTADQVGVDEVVMEGNAPVDVYSVDGRLVVRGADAMTIRSLAPGLYIAGGRRILVK